MLLRPQVSTSTALSCDSELSPAHRRHGADRPPRPVRWSRLGLPPVPARARPSRPRRLLPRGLGRGHGRRARRLLEQRGRRAGPDCGRAPPGEHDGALRARRPLALPVSREASLVRAPASRAARGARRRRPADQRRRNAKAARGLSRDPEARLHRYRPGLHPDQVAALAPTAEAQASGRCPRRPLQLRRTAGGRPGDAVPVAPDQAAGRALRVGGDAVVRAGADHRPRVARRAADLVRRAQLRAGGRRDRPLRRRPAARARRAIPGRTRRRTDGPLGSRGREQAPRSLSSAETAGGSSTPHRLARPSTATAPSSSRRRPSGPSQGTATSPDGPAASAAARPAISPPAARSSFRTRASATCSRPARGSSSSARPTSRPLQSKRSSRATTATLGRPARSRGSGSTPTGSSQG